jgi:hypothetical protein
VAWSTCLSYAGTHSPPHCWVTQLGRQAALNIENMNRSSRTHRNRMVYATAVVGVILLGLASRKFPWVFPAFLDQYPGDALWALMILLILGFIWPKLPSGRLALSALLVSFAVEFGQLYQPVWLRAVRQTDIGHLVLGSTFNPMDLVAYAAGICIGFTFESIRYRRTAV